MHCASNRHPLFVECTIYTIDQCTWIQLHPPGTECIAIRLQGPDEGLTVLCLVQECIKVPLASVRYAALQGLVTVLKLIETLPPSDAKVFAEYASLF